MTTRVFISYAREDRDFAEKLYSDLGRQAGVKPWMDGVDLLPGQAWERTIRKAISDSSYFLAVLSRRSVGKRGYVQKEIRQALAIAEEYPDDKIFVIPVRLDDCEPTFDGLRKLHMTDLFPSYRRGLLQLLRVFNYRSEERRSLAAVEAESKHGVVKTLTDRGFGFIHYPPSTKDVYFHHTELRGIMFAELRVGDRVVFSLVTGPKGELALDVSRA